VARGQADRPALERRLRERFSDDAARAAFRALPLLRAWQING